MILGISEGFHDAAIAIIDPNNGDIVHASHSERSSGVKHDRYISPWQIELLDSYEISKSAYYENPILKKSRQIYAGQYKTAFTKRRQTITAEVNHSHHLSHAAAAFQTSDYLEASCVVVDSIGEWDTVSIWSAYYDNCRIAKYKKIYSQKYPNSIGLWYSALTKHVGLKPLEEEYIFMGMAAFGKHDPELEKLLENLHRGIGTYTSQLSNYPNVDISTTAQVVLENSLRKIFSIAKSHSNNICYAGGVALNCVANSKLIKEYGDIWIMPNPGDAGSALGAAALSYKKKLNWNGPYLGREINRKVQIDELTEYLITNKICGIANGKSEFGPRALGNRSLIADPRGIDIKNLVNNIKKRQLFRPFAPSILAEHAEQYFRGSMSRYMSTTAECKFSEQFPAIIHADNTSRVQLVYKDDNTILRKVLESWYIKTGCPMLLNTSLNIRGMPMVDSWQDAMQFEKLYDVKIF
jgi:carbamoyltransferase